MTLYRTKLIGTSRHRLSTDRMRLSLFVLLLMTICCQAIANGDPVVRYSSINRVANPEPLSISQIRIVREQVKITHVDGYNCFDITYLFKNESKKDFPEIHYGFPIDYLVADEQEACLMNRDYYAESIYEIGWNDKLIKDISFRFNDNLLQFHSAKESVRQAGFFLETYNGQTGDSIPTDAVNRCWFYTMFSMPPHSEATFNVSYKVYANSETAIFEDSDRFSQYVRKSNLPDTYTFNHPLLLRYFPEAFTILYDFTPAKHFGNGSPFYLNVDIDLSNLDNPYLVLDGTGCYTSHLIRSHYVTSPEDLNPIDLNIYYSSHKNRERIERLIAPFKLSSDKFDLHQSQSAIEIEFHEPTFVSELVCDLDTTLIKSINSSIIYSDGRVEEYCYIQNPPSKWDDKITSPIILTITDQYHNGLMQNGNLEGYSSQSRNLNDPYYKIRKIQLDFNMSDPSAKDSACCRNIRILDSRLFK